MPRLRDAILLACLFLGLATAGARAQFARFENYSDDRGLGNTSVSALAQDADGYILLGTEAGLYRYDGSRIAPYDVSVGLPPGEWVRKIMIDRAGRTWVVTSDDIFVRYGQRFTRVDVGAALDVRSPHLITLAGDSVIVDNGGRFLRASVGARAVGRFLPLFDQAMLAATPDLSQARFVVADTDGALLVGCGQAICRMKDRRITTYGPAAGLPPDAWRAAIRTPDGTLWARSVERLAWRGPHDASFQVVTIPDGHGQSYGRIPSYLDLVADRRGGILTQGGDGLLDWDGKRWRSYGHHEGGLSATPIEALMFDREESLWIGSMGHGAFRSVGLGNWEHWTADDGLPSDLIWGMTRLRDGQFWVATFGDTVALDGRPGSFTRNGSPSVAPSVSRSIPGGSAVVQASRDGRLWTAPPDQPLARFDGARNKLERFPVSGHVSTVLLDRDDQLWLCTAAGLYLIADADAPAPAVHAELVLSHVAFQVALDPSGTVWALTRDGLFRRDAAGRFDLVAAAVLPDGQSGGMAFTPGGDLWVFTESEGVLRFHPGPTGLQRLSPLTASVLGSNDVLFLHRDRRGWMWVGTDHGIDVFDGRSWRRFDKMDGLISNDMDQWSVYEDGDGSMWFGTSHGLSHLLDPARTPSTTTLHPLVTGLSIGRRTLSPSPSIRIDGSTASLVVRFVDLDYARGNVAFRYRLRGLDTGWNDTMGHDVRYAGLPAGTFRFELVAVDTVHGEVSAPVGFTLHIRAPWWRRVWFYGLCALLAAAALAGAWQGRVRLLLGWQRRLEEMVGARTAEIEQARNELQRLAMSDVLTGLPNRRAIMGALDEAVAAASRTETVLAVLLCDIDHFKSINDRFGHLAGDKVLAAFGGRLSAIIGAGETAGRYGGEEFLVVLPGAPDLVMARVAAIRSAISDPPYHFGDGSRVVTSSGGVAFLRPSDTTVTLVARADVALYKAKENGRNRIEMESPDSGPGSPQEEAAAPTMDRRRGSRSMPGTERRPEGADHLLDDLERDLRLALAGEQFVLHYQPVVDVERDVVTSCEALLRWRSPTRGNVSPVDFIPFAETIGLMPEIGDWVLRAACREAGGWPEAMKVSVNLSPSQFHLPDLVQRIVGILAETGLKPARLELEVTETAMIADMAAASSMLEQLRALGISIALDDFGTGYSSLSFLRTLPFTRIKIDKSFVQELGVKPEAAAIVRAIAGLCDSLDAAVTAEGVETDHQIELLRELGCLEIQGYRIGRPCPPHELRVWMDAFASSHSVEPTSCG